MNFALEMEPYRVGTDFEIYLMQLMNYYEVTNRTDDTFKSRLLVNLLGIEEGSKIMNAFKPKHFTEFSFDEVVAVCKQILCKRRIFLRDHYQFNLRHQKSRQSLGNFANELKQAAQNCRFGNYLDIALRDRFVMGIASDVIRAQLLNLSSNATFSQVLSAARTEERILGLERNRHSEAISGQSRTRSSRSKSRSRMAFRERTRSLSRPLEITRACYECYRVGHYASDCHTRQQGSATLRTSHRQLNQNRGFLERNNDDDDGLASTVDRFGNLKF